MNSSTEFVNPDNKQNNTNNNSNNIIQQNSDNSYWEFDFQ